MAQSTTDPTRIASLLAEGRHALLSGDKARAQSALQAVVELDPLHEEAWIWLSGTQANPAAMAECLQQVLAINPGNEQAQEGLRWIAAEYGAPAADAPTPAAPSAAPPEPTYTEPEPLAQAVSLHPRYHSQWGSTLIEAALHPFAVGALLGLLRLVGWLRPLTLVALRAAGGQLGLTSALSLALAAAVLHGGALLLMWLALAWMFDRLRATGRGDRFDSFVRTGTVWQPGYLWGAALLVAALGLGLSPRPWIGIALVCWLLLLLGAEMIAVRLWRLLADVEVPARRRRGVFVRLVLVAGAVGAAGLWLAGVATAALVR